MSFALILTRTVVPGNKRRLPNSTGKALTKGDFALIMDGAPIRRRLDDGTCWLWHRQEMPWLSASFKEGNGDEEAYIVFAVSYGHLQFIKVFADAFDLALRMARHLGARVFESASFQEVTRENAADFLAPHGPYVTAQADLWMKTAKQLNDEIKAPLEYPMGRADALNDFFVFFLDPKTPIMDLREVVARCNLCVAPDSLSANSFALQDRGTGNILSQVILRPNDNALQIRPFYWMEPFSRVAAETLNLVCQLQGEFGGSLHLRDKPVTAEFKVQLSENSKALGIEFFLWLTELSSSY